jgi:hypothetical protein
VSREISARIARLLQLCGEDPSAAFAARHDSLPLVRREEGWLALRREGVLVFVDDSTGRVLEGLPAEWRADAVNAVAERYPGLLPYIGS